MRITIFVIILLFPFVALAHEGEVHLAIDPTALPGERGYFWEKIGEWIDVNLFILSTKQKQEKKLKLSDERVAELLALLERKEIKNENLQEIWRRYESTLLDVEYMVEKIITLDGNEISIAEKLEKATSIHEQVLAQALELTSQENRPLVLQSLNFARIQNEAIFTFMVKNYQATDADIKKHQNILEEQIKFTESLIDSADIDNYNRVNAKYFLKEARKFQEAGFNFEAYGWVNKAKNLIYSRIISQF